MIVQSNSPVALIGGGQIDAGDLQLARTGAELLVAADGGARAALAAGEMPDAVIGDLDSLGEARAQLPATRLFPICEQDSTDFAKALRSIGAPLVQAAGFLGARVDHQLAVFNTLVRRANPPCLLIGAHEVLFHAPPELHLPLDKGSTVSLFPMAPVMGRSEGLEWPIDGLEFAPDGRVGTSNRATGPVRLVMDGPGMLMMVPRADFTRVRRVFLAPDFVHWPARAE